MKSKSVNTVEMCSGSLFLNILKFAFPFMLTTMLQKLYNVADVVVVGRYAGREALAGVGTTTSLTTLLLNMFVGLSVGASVTLGRAMGAKNNEYADKIIHTAIKLCIIGGLFVSAIGVFFAEPLLNMIAVPESVMPQAKAYMQILFSGQTFSLIYNFGSAILRTKGDTKRPLYIVTASGIINVVLNLVFVICFKMQAGGVALATVISQIFTAVLILRVLCTEQDGLKLEFKKLKFDKTALLDIIKIGIPSGAQSSIFSVANIIIQSSVNSFGAAAIAGSAAATNISTFYNLALNSMYQASVVFVSRNYGAKLYKRIKKVVIVCSIYACAIWAIEALITIFWGEAMISLFAPGDFEAIRLGTMRLMIVGVACGVCGLMNVMTGALRGLGKSTATMFVSIAGVCGIRILWIFTVFRAIRTIEVLFVSLPLSWIGTFIMQATMFGYFYKKELKKNPS